MHGLVMMAVYKNVKILHQKFNSTTTTSIYFSDHDHILSSKILSRSTQFVRVRTREGNAACVVIICIHIYTHIHSLQGCDLARREVQQCEYRSVGAATTSGTILTLCVCMYVCMYAPLCM